MSMLYMQTGELYRNLAIVQQKMYSYLTYFKNIAFHAKIFYALRRRAPTILDPPLDRTNHLT